MKIGSVLTSDHIILNAVLKDKDSLLRFIADTLVRLGHVSSPENLYHSLKKREEIMSTGIGGGIALPHAFSAETEDLALLFIRPENPLPFQSLDGKPVDIAIPIIVPGNESSLHLRTLAAVSALCRKPEFMKEVRRAAEPQQIWELIRETEEKGSCG
ncbi:MAG: PTS sugar transporter subunit IIA [Desulfococcaceae bacterium]|jgi:mannitol/fructose-specific phosphotransferase system IIA component (Ntr-type)|nr:PTS sugar transporter subunit IIA [Desulfococcaceae bacterium]